MATSKLKPELSSPGLTLPCQGYLALPEQLKASWFKLGLLICQVVVGSISSGKGLHKIHIYRAALGHVGGIFIILTISVSCDRLTQ